MVAGRRLFPEQPYDGGGGHEAGEAGSQLLDGEEQLAVASLALHPRCGHRQLVRMVWPPAQPPRAAGTPALDMGTK